MEGSFAQTANCHGGKRARWRRLWRQQIQDWLIAACQNVKLLVKALRPGPLAGEIRVSSRLNRHFGLFLHAFRQIAVEITHWLAPTSRTAVQLN